MSDLTLLIDMGFPEETSRIALEKSNGVQEAAEWLLAQREEEEKVENVAGSYEESSSALFSSTSGSDGPSVSANPITSAGPSAEPIFREGVDEARKNRYMLCEECNIRCKTEKEMENHAIQTGHDIFSESPETCRSMTDEEREEQLKRVTNLVKERRAEKKRQDELREIEQEKSRRQAGQELASTKQWLAQQELNRIADEIKQDKLQARLARQKVLEDIKRDKQARQENFSNTDTTSSSASCEGNSKMEKDLMEVSKSYDTCRLQIRLSNGETLIHTFSPNDEFSAVRSYIEINRTDGNERFELMTAFPRYTYTDEDMSRSLSDLGLSPSACLILRKKI